jgi:hypothetical protein
MGACMITKLFISDSVGVLSSPDFNLQIVARGGELTRGVAVKKLTNGRGVVVSSIVGLQMMRILDRGTSSVQDMVAIVLFNILPQIADIIIACTYIAAALEVTLYHTHALCCQHVLLHCDD